jgi:flavin reductase (DIM6/NTAB) family NADH-FMN oxidoreductase RutF
MDAKTYRNAMKQQAGAVAIIATGTNDERTGMTATAVCSLSDDPPMLLICVNKSASPHALIKNTGSFSVNFLSTQQEEVAACFAGMTGLKSKARFAYGKWTTLETGAPVLMDALASFDCELINEHQYSTHSIFIGAVKSVQTVVDAGSLLYFRGKFTGLVEVACEPV